MHSVCSEDVTCSLDTCCGSYVRPIRVLRWKEVITWWENAQVVVYIAIVMRFSFQNLSETSLYEGNLTVRSESHR